MAEETKTESKTPPNFRPAPQARPAKVAPNATSKPMIKKKTPKKRNSYTAKDKARWRKRGGGKDAYLKAKQEGYKGSYDSYKALVYAKGSKKGPGRPKGAKNKPKGGGWTNGGKSDALDVQLEKYKTQYLEALERKARAFDAEIKRIKSMKF